MCPADGRKMSSIYNTTPYRDCFAVTVPKEVLGTCWARQQQGGKSTNPAGPTPEDLMLSFARAFYTSPVFKMERRVFKHLLRSPFSHTDSEIQHSELQPGFKLDGFEVGYPCIRHSCCVVLTSSLSCTGGTHARHHEPACSSGQELDRPTETLDVLHASCRGIALNRQSCLGALLRCKLTVEACSSTMVNRVLQGNEA